MARRPVPRLVPVSLSQKPTPWENCLVSSHFSILAVGLHIDGTRDWLTSAAREVAGVGAHMEASAKPNASATPSMPALALIRDRSAGEAVWVLQPRGR